MIVKVDTWRITWRYLIAALVFIIAMFGITSGMFMGYSRETNTFYTYPIGPTQIIILVLIFVLPIVFYFITIKNYYYIIENKSFIIKKYGKTLEFDYKNIQFIDIDESKRKGQVIFYAPTCRTKYLLGDKNGLLLETLIKKCPPTMSVHEFKMKHPEERY